MEGAGATVMFQVYSYKGKLRLQIGCQWSGRPPPEVRSDLPAHPWDLELPQEACRSTLWSHMAMTFDGTASERNRA